MASLAFADSTTKSDPKGDSKKGELDFRSATVAHAGRDTFKHTVRTYNTGKTRSLRLDLGSGGGGGRPSHMVARFEGKPGIYEFTNAGPKRVGPATFKQHTTKKFSYTFNLKHLGLPSKYRWQWAIQVKGSFEPADTLPDRAMVVHNVSTGD